MQQALAKVAELLGAASAAVAAIVGQVQNGKAISAWLVISAVVAALGHAFQHSGNIIGGSGTAA